MVITPVAATAMRLRDAGFYSDLAKVVRRGEMVDPEQLIEHLRIVGYNQVDVVEMPGEFAHRGGLLDVYPPELDRPVRIELFGDEVESIRKFDPGTQRSAAATEEVVLLPLTETPVEEETLAAINARLVGGRLAGDEEVIEEAVRATGVAVFPGWELYAPVVGAKENIFDDLLPGAVVVLDEPDALEEAHDAWWTKVTEAHERSLVGNLVRPEDLYLTPEQWRERLQQATIDRSRATGHRGRRRRRTSHVADAADNALPRLGCGHDRGSRPARTRRQARHLRRFEHRRSRAPGRRLQRIQPVVSHRQPHAQAGQRSLCRGVHLLRRKTLRRPPS